MRLNEERSVTDPGNADFTGPNDRELGRDVIALALGKERRDQHFGQIVPLVPIGSRAHFYPCGLLCLGAVLRRFADDVASALS